MSPIAFKQHVGYILNYKFRETFNFSNQMRTNISLTFNFQLTPPLCASLDTQKKQSSCWHTVTTPNIVVSQPSCYSRAVYEDYIWACRRPLPVPCPALQMRLCPTPSSQTDPSSFLKCPSCDRCPLSFGGRRWWPPSAPRSPESCRTLFSSSWRSLTWRRQERDFQLEWVKWS